MIRFHPVCPCLALVSITFLINGCSVFQPDRFSEQLLPDENSGKAFHSIKEISCQPLQLIPGKDKARIVINQYTARLEQPQGTTPVLAYRIPEQGLHHIAINSYVVNPSWDKQGDELFYPEIALLDQDNNLLSKLDPHHIGYKKPGFTTGEGVSTSFNIDNRGETAPKTTCLLIYTTDELRKKTTTLLNEEKEFARVRGVVPPPLPDPVARHGNNGLLTITLKSSEMPVADVQPKLVVYYPPRDAETPYAEKSAPDPEIQKIRQHYTNEVKTALAQGEISKALDSRSELKGVVKKIEHYFLTHFGKPASALKAPTKPANADFATEAQHHFLQKLHGYFKVGKGSLALGLLDDAKQLQTDVDHLFDR